MNNRLRRPSVPDTGASHNVDLSISYPNFQPYLRHTLGVDPSVETRKTGTDFVSLLSSVQQQDCARSLLRPAKRTRALLESNPRRNNWLKTHRNDGRPGKPNSLFGFLLVHRTDRSSYALENSCCNCRLVSVSNGFERRGRHVSEA